MVLSEIEDVVIHCIKDNLELSGESVVPITKNTKPARDLKGFDSLRTLEVIVSIEEKIGCELPHDKIFSGKKIEDITVTSIANAIDEVRKEVVK